MSEQANVQQVTEAQLYEILGRVYVSWQIASRERATYLQAAQQNYLAAQKAQRERDEAKEERRFISQMYEAAQAQLAELKKPMCYGNTWTDLSAEGGQTSQTVPESGPTE